MQSLSCPSLPFESELKPNEVFIVNSNCPTQGEIFFVSTKPSPSNEVISFEWSNLIEYHLHSSVPFQIVVRVSAKSILHTIVNEGDFVSILSFTTWKAIGSPHIAPATNQILDFNRIPTTDLGIRPQFPITLEGKTICIYVMVI